MGKYNLNFWVPLRPRLINLPVFQSKIFRFLVKFFQKELSIFKRLINSGQTTNHFHSGI